MPLPEWIENFAKDNIHPLIIQFLENHGAHYYKVNDDQDTYSSPRSWTFLSNYITEVHGENAAPSKFKHDILEFGSSFIHPESSSRFARYLDQISVFSLDDILNSFEKIEKELNQMKKGGAGRSRLSEFMSELKKRNIKDMNEKQILNMGAFLEYIDDDESAGFFVKQLENLVSEDLTSPKMKKFFKKYKRFANIIAKQYGA